MPVFLKSRVRIIVVLFLLGLIAGFLLTAQGFETWDSNSHLDQSRWLIYKFLGQERGRPHPFVVWYGPFWETFLGIFSEGIFSFFKDSTWIRYSVNFASLPMFLGILYFQLRDLGTGKLNTILTLAMIMGNVRILGHALMNTKDFPLAFIYLIVSFQFIILYFKKPVITRKFVFLGTLLSLIPYLIRPPMLLHTVLFWIYILYRRTVTLKPFKNTFRFAIFFKSLSLTIRQCILFTGFWIYALWPTLWPFQLRGWIDSFRRFSKFPLTGLNQAYAISFDVSQIPNWYFWSWFPVIFNPVAFAAVFFGLVILTMRLSQKNTKWFKPFLVLALLPLVTILLKKPTLYDEERHLMFLFPLFSVMASIGLYCLRESFKIILSTCVVSLSLLSFFQWGKYTYIYKSPIITQLGFSNGFLGDYWGVCINQAARELPKFTKGRISVITHAPRPALELQAKRLRESLILGDPSYPEYRFLDGNPGPGDIAIAYNRFGASFNIFEDTKNGKAIKLWEDHLPSGEPGCIIAQYPN